MNRYDFSLRERTFVLFLFYQMSWLITSTKLRLRFILTAFLTPKKTFTGAFLRILGNLKRDSHYFHPFPCIFLSPLYPCDKFFRCKRHYFAFPEIPDVSCDDIFRMNTLFNRTLYRIFKIIPSHFSHMCKVHCR